MDEDKRNEQEPVTAAPSTATTTNDDPLTKSWSWGAFILDPFFVIAVRKYLFLLLYLLYLIPVLNFLAMIGIKIFLGLKGTEFVKESNTFASNEERRGFLKAINHAGFIVFILALILFGLSFLGILAGVGFSFLQM